MRASTPTSQPTARSLRPRRFPHPQPPSPTPSISLGKRYYDKTHSYHALEVAQPSDTRSLSSSANGTDDREACSKTWIALYTRSRSEKRVKAFLDKLGIKTYLPIQTQMRQWSDRKKLVDVVIIPMVIFVYADKRERSQIINHPLIIRPFTLPGSKDIAIIPVKQIEQLKFILGQSDYMVSFDPTEYRIKDKIQVVRGPLMGLTGEVINSENTCLEIAVSVGIGGSARLKIDKIDVRLI